MERPDLFQRVSPLLAAAISVLVFIQPMLAVYVLIAVLMVYLTRRHPVAVLTLVFVAAPLQRDLSEGGRTVGGFSFSVAELLFAAALPGFLLHSTIDRRRILFGPTCPFVLVYLGVCVISCACARFDQDALVSIAQMVLYLVLAVMAYATFAPKAEVLLAVYRTTVVVGVGLSVLMLTGGMNLIGANKNGMGASLAASLLICADLWFAAKRRTSRAALCTAFMLMGLALLFTLSRGAWLGTIGGLFAITMLRREFRVMVRVAALLAILFPIFWSLLAREERTYAFNFDRSEGNISQRWKSIEIAQSHFGRSPMIGTGVGLRKSVDATNIVWFTLAETGVLGLLAFTLLHAAFFRMIRDAQTRIPGSEPIYSLLVISTALIVSKLLHGMVDHYWSRGVIMMSWASVGMATRAYYDARVQCLVEEGGGSRRALKRSALRLFAL